MNPSPVHCYAARRLNPLQGVVQVVSMEGARALSHDGRLWEIQVLADIPDHTWGSLDTGSAGQQFYRFGSWHPEKGLRQVPANPLLDLGAMQAASARLVTDLQARLGELPFALEDRYECWQLDRQERPVALVASATDKQLIDRIRPHAWRATLPVEHGFVSASLQAHGIPPHDGQNPRRHAQELETLVRKAATVPHWYYRDRDGNRTACHDDSPAVDSADFPPLGLREHWPEAWQVALVRDYLDWCAPELLTWDHLDAETRAGLEIAACRRATAVARCWPLYPEVIDQQRLTRARVEARLRGSKDSG